MVALVDVVAHVDVVALVDVVAYVDVVALVDVVAQMWGSCRCDSSCRCGGSLVAHQTSGAEVPGSNPTSTTMMRCRIIVKKSRKSQGREGNLPLRQKKIYTKKHYSPKSFSTVEKDFCWAGATPPYMLAPLKSDVRA